MIEEAPPLPPLPSEEEAQPPLPPAGPPSVPAPPPPPTAQTSYQSASRTACLSQQSRWQQPGHFGTQQFTAQQAIPGNDYPPQFCGSSVPEGNGSGSRFSAIRVKTEDGAVANVETAAGTLSKTAHMGNSQQQAPQSGGAIQFGFGGTGKPAGKVIVYCHLSIAKIA